MKIFISGASGYVGGRLALKCAELGLDVRCGARRAEYLKSRLPKKVECVAFDASDSNEIDRALQGCDVAFYLIHSLGASSDKFEELETICAKNFAVSARKNNVKRIIYLGGIIAKNKNSDLSLHMRSRENVGDILRASGVLTIELRASIIIGSGSISFEICRALCERLPIMTVPTWTKIQAQPIAIDDVIKYLIASVSLPIQDSKIFEIGGAEKTSYLGIMQAYCSLRGLKRWFIPVPVLSPKISSLWLGLVTPIYARIGRKLIESIKNPTVVDNPSDNHIFNIVPLNIRQSIEMALQEEGVVASHWSDSISSTFFRLPPNADYSQAKIVDCYEILVASSAQNLFEVLQQIGGKNGWFFASFLWQIRGAIDLLIGGPGLKRSRRNAKVLRLGDAVDWWRVEDVKDNQHILLRAEMKLPGQAWLRFNLESASDGCTKLVQTAFFNPHKIWGQLYWYGLYPVHVIIFKGMLYRIKKRAEEKRYFSSKGT